MRLGEDQLVTAEEPVHYKYGSRQRRQFCGGHPERQSTQQENTLLEKGGTHQHASITQCGVLSTHTPNHYPPYCLLMSPVCCLNIGIRSSASSTLQQQYSNGGLGAPLCQSLNSPSFPDVQHWKVLVPVSHIHMVGGAAPLLLLLLLLPHCHLGKVSP